MGEPVCWIHMLCPDCGLLIEDEDARSCPHCGAKPTAAEGDVVPASPPE